MCDFSTWMSGIGDALGGAAESVGGALSGAGESIGSALGNIPGALSDFGSYVGNLLGQGGQAAGPSAMGFMEPSAFGGPVSDFTPSIPIPAGSPIFDPNEPFGAAGGVFGGNQVASGGTAPLMPVHASLLGPVQGPVLPPIQGPPDPSLFSQATGFMQDNYKWMLPALGIGYSALRPKAELPGAAQQEAYAQRMGQIGQQMTEPLLTGQLPAGYQSALDRMQKSAEAQVKSRYAQMGLSGSSMERQELAAIPQQLETQKLQIAQSLAAQGMQSMGLSSAAYNQIAQNTLEQDKELANALALFGAAAIRS